MASDYGLPDIFELKRSTSSWLSWRSDKRVVQDSLYDFIGAGDDSETRKLLEGYKKIAKREVGPRLPHLVWCGEDLAVADDEPIYVWLMRIGDAVALSPRPRTQFCVSVVSKASIESSFSQTSRLRMSFPGDSQALAVALQRVLAWSMARSWSLAKPEREALLSAIHQPDLASPKWECRLPSQCMHPVPGRRKSLNVDIIAAARRRSSSITVPTMETPTKSVDTFSSSPQIQVVNASVVFSGTFMWHSRLAPYTNDYVAVIWSHHQVMPKPEYAHIRIMRFQLSSGADCCRAFITLESVSILSKLKGHFSKLEGHDETEICINDNPGIIVALCTVIRDDLKQFMEESVRRLNDLKIAARKTPSGFKLRYLTHYVDVHTQLEQTCSSLRSDITRLREMWQPISSLEGSSNRISMLCDTLHDLEKDIAYLQDEISKQCRKVPKLKAEIKGHLEISRTVRTSILTFLATLYVPLSFLTSFFGMNISSSNQQISTFNTTNTLLNDSSTFVWNGTDSNSIYANESSQVGDDELTLYAVMSSSGNVSFDINHFILAAVLCVVLTVPLPLVIGPVVRFTIRWINRFIELTIALLASFFTLVALSELSWYISVLCGSGPIAAYSGYRLWKHIKNFRTRSRGPSQVVHIVHWTISLSLQIITSCVVASYGGWGTELTQYATYAWVCAYLWLAPIRLLVIWLLRLF